MLSIPGEGVHLVPEIAEVRAAACAVGDPFVQAVRDDADAKQQLGRGGRGRRPVWEKEGRKRATSWRVVAAFFPPAVCPRPLLTLCSAAIQAHRYESS